MLVAGMAQPSPATAEVQMSEDQNVANAIYQFFAAVDNRDWDNAATVMATRSTSTIPASARETQPI